MVAFPWVVIVHMLLPSNSREFNRDSDTIMVMLLISFCRWWYTQGWLQLIQGVPTRIQGVSDDFSVGQILKTLFAPWRRIITYPGRTIQERFRAWTDNMFSRVVGFFVRLLVIMAAVIVITFITVVSIIEVILWPLLPLMIPGGLIAGVLL